MCVASLRCFRERHLSSSSSIVSYFTTTAEVKIALHPLAVLSLVEHIGLGAAATDNDVVDRDMNKFDKEANEAHDSETDAGGEGDLLELCKGAAAVRHRERTAKKAKGRTLTTGLSRHAARLHS